MTCESCEPPFNTWENGDACKKAIESQRSCVMLDQHYTHTLQEIDVLRHEPGCRDSAPSLWISSSSLRSSASASSSPRFISALHIRGLSVASFLPVDSRCSPSALLNE